MAKRAGSTGKNFLKLLLAVILCGCVPYTFPREPPKGLVGPLEKNSLIQPGITTRAQVNERLGNPIFSSRPWMVEVYHVGRMQQSTFGVIIFPLIPFVANVNWDGYALVTYDDADRVAAFSVGVDEENRTRRQPLLRVADMTLTKDYARYSAKSHHPELVLLAEGHRLDGYLKHHSQPDACTLVAACEKYPCPDLIAIGNKAAIDPRPVFRSCQPDDHCGFFTDMVTVPVLHLASVPPGQHQVVMSSSHLPGKSEATIACSAGGLLYARIRGEINGGELKASLDIMEKRPERWSQYKIFIWNSN